MYKTAQFVSGSVSSASSACMYQEYNNWARGRKKQCSGQGKRTFECPLKEEHSKSMKHNRRELIDHMNMAEQRYDFESKVVFEQINEP